jgi:hypothetical protein
MMQYSSDAKNFDFQAVQKFLQKQKKKDIFQVQSLENLDTCDSVSHHQASEMGVSESTNASTKKEDAPAKVEDYFGGNNGFEILDQQSEVKYGDSRSSFMMPRASTQLPFAEMAQELSEPIAPTKNMLFPIKY